MPSARSRPAITSADAWSFAWWIRTPAIWCLFYQGTARGRPL